MHRRFCYGPGERGTWQMVGSGFERRGSGRRWQPWGGGGLQNLAAMDGCVLARTDFVSQKVFLKLLCKCQYQHSSTYHFPLLIWRISWRICAGIVFFQNDFKDTFCEITPLHFRTSGCARLRLFVLQIQYCIVSKVFYKHPVLTLPPGRRFKLQPWGWWPATRHISFPRIFAAQVLSYYPHDQIVNFVDRNHLWNAFFQISSGADRWWPVNRQVLGGWLSKTNQ